MPAANMRTNTGMNFLRRLDNHESLRPEMLATGIRPTTSLLDTCSDPLSLANFLSMNFPQVWLPEVPDHSAGAFSTYRQHRSEPGLPSPLVRSSPARPLCLFRLVGASFDPSRKTPSSPQHLHWRSFSE